MSKKTRMPHGLPRLAFVTRVLLHSSVLFVLALLPCATPSAGLLNVTEFEAPLDQGEPSEEEVVIVPARTRVDHDQSGPTLLFPLRSDFSLDATSIVCVPHSGHRLPNHLLAPLRC